MTNTYSAYPSSDEIISHFRKYIATVLPSRGLHVTSVTGITFANGCVSVRIDPTKADAEDWAFDDTFKSMGLATIYGSAIGFNDETGTRMRSVVDKIVVIDRNGSVYDASDMETVHKHCAGDQ